MHRVILCSILCLSASVVGCSNCKKVKDNYDRGNVNGTIDACQNLGREILRNKKKVQKTIDQCSDSNELQQQDGNDFPQSSGDDVMLQLGGATASTADIAEACESCAGAAAICAAVGAPLPQEALDLEGACCQVVGAS